MQNAIALLQLAVALLTAALAPNVPADLRAMSISVANQVIVASNQYIEMSKAVSFPQIPADVATLTPVAEVLQSATTTTFSAPGPRPIPRITEFAPRFDGKYVNGLSLTSSVPIVCGGVLGVSCAIQGINAVAERLVSCDTAYDHTRPLFEVGTTSCLFIASESDGTDTRIPVLVSKE